MVPHFLTLSEAIDSLQQLLFSSSPTLSLVIEALKKSGGRPLLVGGAVRDLFMGISVKDLDIEVYGLSVQQLEKILQRFGHVRVVGKQFGVIRIDGLDVDWSIPRKDSAGRKPQIKEDPFMSLRDACARRDLTINAMGIDLITYQLEDPFDGQRDLRLGKLRAPDIHLFVQDPLRFFRVMQFIGRFEMTPDDELNEVCGTMDLSTLSQERIFQEFEKLFIKSQRPSLGIVWLEKIGRLKEILPELHATIVVKQDAIWHPEGSVFEHSMQALDAAASYTYSSDELRLIVLMASLCHDLGKIVAQQVIEGRIRAFGHDVKGVPFAYSFLKHITGKKNIKDAVLKLVRYHMLPGQFIKNNAGPGAYKRLAVSLHPQVTLRTLAMVATADKRGRNPKKDGPLQLSVIPEVEQFIIRATEYGVVDGLEQPLLHGRDVADVIEAGPEMGKLLEYAYTVQLKEGITDKEELKMYVLTRLKRKKGK